jgi:hypothetical protein
VRVRTRPNRTLLICALFSSLILRGSASTEAEHWHQDKGHWKLHWQHRNFDDDDEFGHQAGGCFLPPRDVWLVSDYYAKRYRPLAPGVATHYYRTGPLPAGWKGQLESLPTTLDGRLVALPEGQLRAVVGGSLIVYDPQTQMILDTVVLFGR